VGSEYRLNNENGRIIPEMQQAANESAYYAVTYLMQEKTHKMPKYSLWGNPSGSEYEVKFTLEEATRGGVEL